MFCLPNQLATEFKKRLKSGEITPEKLMQMKSEERSAFFSEFLGNHNAKEINAAFESKLLLKNQQQGIINWAKGVAGLKPEIKRDLLSRVEKMTKILQPTEVDAFLGDIAEKRLGIDVTAEEADKIARLAKDIADAKAAMQNGGDRLVYGKAKVDFYDYVNELKVEAGKKTVLDRILHPLDTAVEFAGLSKSVKASLDNSSIFTQGWKPLMTNPTIWLKNAGESFINIAKTIGGKNVMRAVNADIVSRPTYDLMQKAKLAVGTIEEAYPVNWAEKVPVLGRVYKASQDAYTAFVHKVRADVFDTYLDIAKKSGVDMTDKFELESAGKLVNSLTGRGSMGRMEPVSNIINNVFFSPRWVKGNIDVLTLHSMDKMSWFARKRSAINLTKMITGAAAILVIADAVWPDSVEWDPRSSDFGKVRIGDTRFDVTGKMSSLVTLVARWKTGSSKSANTGVVMPIDSGKYGAMTSGDLVVDFFSNKLSPAASIVKDLFTNTTREGEKPTLSYELKQAFLPLPISNYQELSSNPKSAPLLLSLMLDAMGITANTYSGKLSEAEKLFEEYKNLPREEANAKSKALKIGNPDLYDELKQVVEDEKLGISPKDKYVKTLGVKDGERANYIWDELSRLPSKEEKNAYMKELKDKNIVTPDVFEQLKELKEGGAKTNDQDSIVNENISLGEVKKKAKSITDEKSMIELTKLYAEAAAVDPFAAVIALFTSEQLKDVRGGTAIMERIIQGVDPNTRLDHIVPLQLGGDNADSNLKVVSIGQHAKNTPVENYLGNLLKDGKVSKYTARQMIIAFKEGDLTFDEIKTKYPK